MSQNLSLLSVTIAVSMVTMVLCVQFTHAAPHQEQPNPSWKGANCQMSWDGYRMECSTIQNVRAVTQDVLMKSTSNKQNKAQFRIAKGFAGTIGQQNDEEQFKTWTCWTDELNPIACDAVLEQAPADKFKCHNEWPIGHQVGAVKCDAELSSGSIYAVQYFVISREYLKGNDKIYLSYDQEGNKPLPDGPFL
eukprot:Nk52_evm1s2352 gene=Nk52_evmTU1s2352